MVAYGGGHVAMLTPVAIALKKAGIRFTFLALTTAGSYLDRHEIPYIGYRHLIEAQDDDVQSYANELILSKPLVGSIQHEETVAYLGLNYRELVRDNGSDQARMLFEKYGRQAFLPVKLFVRILEWLKPTLVLATNSPRSEQAAILASRQLNIPSICAVDLFALQEVQWIGEAAYADKVCVLNEQVRKMFIEYGRKPEEIVITGNPAFDRLLTKEVFDSGEILRHARGWNDGCINILWASQVEPDKHPRADRIGDPLLPRRVETYLREFVAVNLGFRLVVRYHPSENEIFNPDLRVEFSPTSEDIGALLHAVDVVVVMTSTVAFEASIVGRTVISVDKSIFTDDAPFSKMGISLGVNTIEGLGSLLLGIHNAQRKSISQIQKNSSDEITATYKLMKVIDSFF